jgi:hypothetical protein
MQDVSYGAAGEKGPLGSLNAGQGNGWDRHSRRRFEPCLVAKNVLGAPGGPRPAHLMQFRPVGVESPVEELAPESADVSEQAGCANSSGCRSGMRF